MKCGGITSMEKERGEPRRWDRGSEFRVIESAKGGGLGVREELQECLG